MSDDVERHMIMKLESAGRNLRMAFLGQGAVMGPLMRLVDYKTLFIAFACSVVWPAILYRRWTTARKAAVRNGVTKETVDAMSKSTRIMCIIAVAVYSIVSVVWIDYQLQ